jgi:hypothetical protein
MGKRDYRLTFCGRDVDALAEREGHDGDDDGVEEDVLILARCSC